MCCVMYLFPTHDFVCVTDKEVAFPPLPTGRSVWVYISLVQHVAPHVCTNFFFEDYVFGELNLRCGNYGDTVFP